MGFLQLLLLSSLMFLSTLLASFAPIFLDLSRAKLDIVSTFSNGILIGSALSIVIPEGVAAVYGSIHSGSNHGEEEEVSGWIGMALLAGFILMYFIDSISHSSHSHSSPSSSRRPRSSLRHMPSHLSELEPLSPPKISTDNSNTSNRRDSISSSSEDSPSTSDWTIPMDHNYSPSSHHRSSHSSSNSSLSTLIGLLLHSLSDGISLGASSSLSPSPSSSSAHESTSSSLSSIIFLAIMLHKAPTAFALSNLLLSQASTGSTSTTTTRRGFIKKSLVLFSLSAPLGALGTYLLLKLLVEQGQGGEGLEWYTGLTLVFSGGTFLFVATSHVTNQDHEEHVSGEEELGDGIGEREGTVGKRGKLGLVLMGMVTPGVLGRLVGHGH